MSDVPREAWEAGEAAERERCAKLCDSFAKKARGTESGQCAEYLAQQIRRA